MNTCVLLRASLLFLVASTFSFSTDSFSPDSLSVEKTKSESASVPFVSMFRETGHAATEVSLSGPVGGAYLSTLRGADEPAPNPGRTLAIGQTIRSLRQEGTLAPFDAEAQLSFIQPVKLVDAPLDTSILVAQFVDHNLDNPRQLQDFRCSDRTYDFRGYNHSGTDFVTYPFPWRMLDTDSATVIAAEAGTIVEKSDGHADRNCTFGGEGDNTIVLVHADGSRTSYAHMKKGSITIKAVGESVEIGEYLGVIGSSGASTAPHLHFEVHDSAGNLIDPFFDPENATCNTLNQGSWWGTQPAYFDPGISKIITSSTEPKLQQCDVAITHDANSFLPGEVIHLSVFYRHQFPEDVTKFQLRRPDGTTALQWDHQIEEDFLEFSMWTWSITLDTNAPFGTWVAQAEYRGETYTHGYTVTDGLRGDLEERTFLPLVVR